MVLCISCTCLLLSPRTPGAPWPAVSFCVPSSTADERGAGWISAAAVSPPASPPLVPPHAASSVLQALLFTCPVWGDGAPLRHSVSGRLLSWGQAACWNPVLIPSPGKAGRLPGEWVWSAALWTARQSSLCLCCRQEWGVCCPAPSASSHLLEGITLSEDGIWLNLELGGERMKTQPPSASSFVGKCLRI